MKLQDALRSGEETLATLEAKYALKVKRHGVYPNLVQLKYDQINSPMSNPMVQEARGVILDEGWNWRVVARPFDKFFNLGEGNAADINWNKARVCEKLDGSLAIVYFYAGQWHMATSGTPDASGAVGDWGVSFKDLFWQVWAELGYDTTKLSPECTYMFELCTNQNRIVVPHPQNRIVLLGIRNPATGEEYPLGGSPANGDGFECVKTFDLATIEDVLASFDSMDGLHQEGYVVVDAAFQRVKVKHPRYVLLHHMIGSLTQKKLLDTIRRGEMSEILTYFPEWKVQADQLRIAYEDLVTEACIEYQRVRDIKVQKDFALAIKDSKHKSAMFAVRSGKAKTMGEFYSTLRIESLADMLGVKVADDAVPTPEGNA